MVYTPTQWQNNRTPALNEANLNKLEQAVAANDVAVTGKAALNHQHTTSDIPDLDAYGQAVVDSKDAATLQSAQDFTYSQAVVDSKDAATLQSAQDFTYSQAVVDSKDAATLQSAQDFTYSQAVVDSKDAAVLGVANTGVANAATAQAAADAAQSTADNAKEFDAGTRMVFYQAAPVGWVQVPIPDWSMLMAGTSGGGWTGGDTQPFTHEHTTGDFALTEAHNGPHDHPYTANPESGTNSNAGGSDLPRNFNAASTTGSSGSGVPHNHGETSTITAQYATVLICQKS